jgi:hypothetical protein
VGSERGRVRLYTQLTMQLTSVLTSVLHAASSVELEAASSILHAFNRFLKDNDKTPQTY